MLISRQEHAFILNLSSFILPRHDDLSVPRPCIGLVEFSSFNFLIDWVMPSIHEGRLRGDIRGAAEKATGKSSSLSDL